MKKTAKERKRKATPDKKVGRRSGKVTVHKVKPTAKRLRKINAAFIPKMRKPEPLSASARWSMLRPDEISPADWTQLFVTDEELWEAIREEAIEAVAEGMIKEYPADAPANLSRRRLQELQGG